MVLSHTNLFDTDWSFTEERTSAHVHGFHPYPARFIPQIPATLIKQLSEVGETVLDPFCGSGTTLVEATLANRNAIGYDLNPLAILISKVKITPLSAELMLQLNIWLDILEGDFEQVRGQPTLFSLADPLPNPQIPSIPHIDHWFEATVKTELGMLIARITQLEEKDLRDFCFVALSAILVGVSNQDSETRYVRRTKGIKAGETISRFRRKLLDMQVRISEYIRLRDCSAPAKVLTLCGDTRKLQEIESSSVHLIVTSPPYPNAFDYHLYHRFRMFWLGFDPIAMSHKEIGSHLNYQRNDENIDSFIHDMTACFLRINNVLLMGRYCCLVIGDSVFKGTLIKNDEVMIQIAQDCGFALEHNIKRTLHQIKRSFATPARRLKEESIIILRKVSEASSNTCS